MPNPAGQAKFLGQGCLEGAHWASEVHSLLRFMVKEINCIHSRGSGPTSPSNLLQGDPMQSFPKGLCPALVSALTRHSTVNPGI